MGPFYTGILVGIILGAALLAWILFLVRVIPLWLEDIRYQRWLRRRDEVDAEIEEAIEAMSEEIDKQLSEQGIYRVMAGQGGNVPGRGGTH